MIFSKKLLLTEGLILISVSSLFGEIKSSVRIGYTTDYIWRGLNISDFVGSDSGLFDANFDFIGVTSDGLKWNAGLWLADVDSVQERVKFHVALSKSFDPLTVEGGIIRYDFASNPGDTTELFLGLSRNLGSVKVSAQVFYDVDLVDGGIFGEVKAVREFDFLADTKLELMAHYGSTLSGIDDNYQIYGLRSTLRKKLAEALTGSIFVLAERTDGHRVDGNDLYGGVSLTFEL